MNKNDKKELERVCQIWYEESCSTHNFIDDYEKFWLERNSSFILDTIDSDGYVCEEDGCIKGFMTIKNNRILELFVDFPYQKEGKGTDLINLAKALKANTLILNVYEKNTKAIGFYEKLGFVKIKSYKEDITGQPKFWMKWTKS
jgi:GNAT superfamily N-acetyltransferase